MSSREINVSDIESLIKININQSGYVNFILLPSDLINQEFSDSTLINKNELQSITDFSSIVSKIRKKIISRSDNIQLNNAISILQSLLKEIGDENNEESLLGKLCVKIRLLEDELEKRKITNSIYSDLSSRIIQLSDKLNYLNVKKSSLAETTDNEEFRKIANTAEKINTLRNSCAEIDNNIESLHKAKESITRKASEIREFLRNYDSLSDSIDSIKSMILHLIDTRTVLKTSEEDKEITMQEISEKEIELKNYIDRNAPLFDRFKDSDEFDKYMDELENKLTKTKILNEKKVDLFDKESKLKNNRKIYKAYFYYGVLFNAITIAISFLYVTKHYSYLEVLLLVTALFSIFLYYEFWKYRKPNKQLLDVIQKEKIQTDELKASIDKAKDELMGIQKVFGYATTTDIRIKYKEFHSVKLDLENLHRITDIYEKDRTKLGEEKERLEAEIHTILEKSGLIKNDELLTDEILEKFKENVENISNIKTEQNDLRNEYKRISDELEKEIMKKSKIDDEIANIVKTAGNGSDPHLSIENINDIISLKLETSISIKEYEKEIKEKKNLLSSIIHEERTIPEIEEDFDQLTNRQLIIKEQYEAIQMAIEGIQKAQKNHMTKEIIPLISKRIDESIRTLKTKYNHEIIKCVLENITSEDEIEKHILFNDNEAETTISFYYLLINEAINSAVANETPALFLAETLIDEENMGHGADLSHLLLLSKLTQIIYLTSDKTHFDKIAEILKERNIECQKESADDFSVISVLKLPDYEQSAS